MSHLPLIWRPGLRAICIDASGTDQLRHGRLYLVNAVHEAGGVLYLVLAPSSDLFSGWEAVRFKPIEPLCDQGKFPRAASESGGLYPHPGFFERLDGTADGF